MSLCKNFIFYIFSNNAWKRLTEDITSVIRVTKPKHVSIWFTSFNCQLFFTPCTFISLISWSKASTFRPCFPFPLNHESIFLVLTKKIIECNSTTYLALRRSSLTAYHLIICLPCISTVWRSKKIFRHALD